MTRIRPQTSGYIVNAWGDGHSNAATVSKLDSDVLEATCLDTVEEYTDQTLWQAPMEAEMLEKAIAEFEKIKAGF